MSETKWISLKDQKPEEGQDVLLYSNHHNVFQEHIKWKAIGIGHIFSWDGKAAQNNKFQMDSDDTTYVNSTHWMPLPEPPKDSE